jgi:hypothetical protein
VLLSVRLLVSLEVLSSTYVTDLTLSSLPSSPRHQNYGDTYLIPFSWGKTNNVRNRAPYGWEVTADYPPNQICFPAAVGASKPGAASSLKAPGRAPSAIAAPHSVLDDRSISTPPSATGLTTLVPVTGALSTVVDPPSNKVPSSSASAPSASATAISASASPSASTSTSTSKASRKNAASGLDYSELCPGSMLERPTLLHNGRIWRGGRRDSGVGTVGSSSFVFSLFSHLLALNFFFSSGPHKTALQDRLTASSSAHQPRSLPSLLVVFESSNHLLLGADRGMPWYEGTGQQQEAVSLNRAFLSLVSLLLLSPPP